MNEPTAKDDSMAAVDESAYSKHFEVSYNDANDDAMHVEQIADE
jgi:hypothetical protein